MSSSQAEQLIGTIGNAARQQDARDLLRIMSDVTGEDPAIWNAKTIGFGRYHYRYASGQEGDFFKIGFAPTEQHLTLYIMSGLRGFEDILDRIGRHRSSKSTVKVRRLSDIDEDVLGELIRECVRHLDEVERSLGAIPRMSAIPPRVTQI